MDDAVDKRIEEIRREARALRTAVNEIKKHAGGADQVIKNEIERVIRLLDDVDGLLTPDLLAERRDARQWNFWLSNVSQILHLAQMHRMYVSNLIGSFGLQKI